MNYIKQVDKFKITKAEGSTIFYDEDTGSLVVLDELASEIWELINENTFIDEIVNKIREVYDVDEKTVLEDVSNAIADFENSGLIVCN